MSRPPTNKQKRILGFITEYVHNRGCPPSFREIAAEFGISVGTVQDHLISLQNKGALFWIPNKPRSIRLNRELMVRSTIPVPLLGVISAGEGVSIHEEERPEMISVPSNMLTSGFGHYCLRVSGFSMSEDGILDGDVIVVRQQASAEDGDTVVAVINDEPDERATLKKFYHHGDKIELRPRNQELVSRFYEPSQIEVRGKFRGLIRGGDNHGK